MTFFVFASGTWHCLNTFKYIAFTQLSLFALTHCLSEIFVDFIKLVNVAGERPNHLACVS